MTCRPRSAARRRATTGAACPRPRRGGAGYAAEPRPRPRVRTGEWGPVVWSGAPPEQGLDPVERLSRLALVVADLLAPVRAATLSAIMSGLARSVMGPGWSAKDGDAVRLSEELIALEADSVRYLVNAAAEVPGRPGRRRVRFLAPSDPPRLERLGQ